MGVVMDFRAHRTQRSRHKNDKKVQKTRAEQASTTSRSVADEIVKVILTDPTAFWRLIDFCQQPRKVSFTKSQFDLLVKHGLLYQNSSVPFEVRAMIEQGFIDSHPDAPKPL